MSKHHQTTSCCPPREDELNAHGGMWSFKVRKEDTVSEMWYCRDILSLIIPQPQAGVWQEVLLAAIGEQFLEKMEEGIYMPQGS